ncbi:hypothetical protein ACFLZX_01445 [Nanoarchaeota archaeon]
MVVRKPTVEQESLSEATTLIKNEVEFCIHEMGKQALIKMGEHGGYIDMKDTQLSGRNFNLDQTEPTESDGVSLTTSEYNPISYWYYVTTQNRCMGNCEIGSLFPSIEQMEYQINQYIERHILSCLNSFKDFEDQKINVSILEPISVSTIIREEEIDITADYKLKVSRNEVSETLTGFKTSIDVNIAELYQLASDIAIYEVSTQFLERIMMNLISIHSGPDFSRLPPLAGIDHRPFEVTWNVQQVKQMLMSDIMPYFNSIQIADTKGKERVVFDNEPYAQATYDSMFLDIYNQSRQDVTVDFIYNDWPIYLKIHPSNGNSLEPWVREKRFDMMMNLVPPSRTNRYQFFYSISHPIIVRVVKENALGGEPYTILFALESNIRSNKNMRDWYTGEGTAGIFRFGSGESQDLGGTTIPAHSMFCDPDQRLSGNITVKVLDKDTNEPIEGASVSYGCGAYSLCEIDTTKLIDNEAMISGSFPICLNGFIKASKNGYHSSVTDYSTELGTGGELTLYLSRYRTFNATVKKKELMVTGTLTGQANLRTITCCNSPSNMQDGEHGLVVLTKVKEPSNKYESELSQTLVTSRGSEPFQIKLVPGNYEITGLFITENKYFIPANCFRVCTNSGIFGCSSHDYLPDDPIELIQFGGAIMNQTTGYWRLTASDLDSGRTNLEFFVLVNIQAECVQRSCLSNPGSWSPRCFNIDDATFMDQFYYTSRSAITPKFS